MNRPNAGARFALVDAVGLARAGAGSTNAGSPDRPAAKRTAAGLARYRSLGCGVVS
ncbi:hypothetical protein [Microbispora sp. H10836]|uniref:hypothetical protein n=1 Tax=Microbispora sp. H10836 TaxID=2729106 RepID=UPI001472812B|nr:hypothetical protein [Microbispora sp. H10836]